MFVELQRIAITNDDEPLVYHHAGTEGIPLVIINALGQDLGPWQRLVAAVAPRRVLTWDLRGLDATLPPRGFAGHVDDLAAVLDAAGVDSCHLIGWCTGPKTALRFDRRFPGRVLSMVMLNASFKHPARPAEFDTPYERNLEVLCRAVDRRPDNAHRLRDMFAPGAFTNNAGGPAAEAENAVRRSFSSAQSLVAYARQHLEFWADDPTAQIPTYTPTLFIAGACDDIVAEVAVRHVASAFARSSYMVLPDAGHFALADQADRVAGLIEGFTMAAER